MKIKLLFLFLITWLSLSDISGQPNEYKSIIKGVSWIGSDSIIPSSFNEIKEVKGNWISLVTYGDMEAYNVPDINHRKEHLWWGDSDNGVMSTAVLAKSQGIKVMLKPHLVLPSNRKKWRHDISMDNEEDWKKWFASYEQWIIYYARLAETHQIDMFCVGTELYQATVKYPERWSKLINRVREVYSGQVVYAANWYKEVEEISFWSELDYIGIQGYYPLSSRKHPKKSQLLKSWKSKKRQLGSLSKRFEKQVLFTEVGYKNTTDATVTPWIWTKDVTKSKISNEAQKRAYESFFETFWGENWFKGVFIWNWHHTTYQHPDLASYYENRRQRLALWSSQIGYVIDHRIDFSPQKKMAYSVLIRYFAGE